QPLLCAGERMRRPLGPYRPAGLHASATADPRRSRGSVSALARTVFARLIRLAETLLRSVANRIGQMGQFLLDDDATLLSPAHLLGQGHDASGRLLVTNSASVDVRDEIALRIGMSRTRPIGKVSRQALRSGQSRSFADEQNNNFRIENIANIVEDSDAAMAD